VSNSFLFFDPIERFVERCKVNWSWIPFSQRDPFFFGGRRAPLTVVYFPEGWVNTGKT
jgi:hypothetical protein